MKNTTCQLLLIATLALSVFSAGCKKDAEPVAVDPGAGAETGSVSGSNLPQAPEVMAALDRKDYNAAIAGIVQARQSTPPQQEMQFVTLVDEVRIRLLDEAPNDPKAAQALHALRQITGGR